MGPALSHPRVLFADRRDAWPTRILLVMAKRDGRYIAGAINFIGARHAVRPPLGRDRAPPVPAFRALLLPGDRLRDRAQAQARRGRRPGRAQAGARLPAGHHLFGALHRRSGRCAARSPTISSASAPMWRRPATSLRRWRRSARIWSNRTDRIQEKRHAELRSATTFSPRSCAASCPATRSTRTTRRSPSSTSCRARPATRWCCRRRRPATCSTSRPTISPHVAPGRAEDRQGRA